MLKTIISYFLPAITCRGNIRNILYLHEGKGEAFPDPKISNYQVNDPRRRVVLLFWSIFPE